MDFYHYSHRVNFEPADGTGMESWDVHLVPDPQVKGRSVVTRRDGGLPWVYDEAEKGDMDAGKWVQQLWDKQGMPAGKVTLEPRPRR